MGSEGPAYGCKVLRGLSRPLEMRVRIRPAENKSGTFGGETWGSDPPFTRVFVGQNTITQQLANDWLMTHELVHTAFPNVAREHPSGKFIKSSFARLLALCPHTLQRMHGSG